MIDLKNLKELIRLMKANDLIELDLRDEQGQITLKRPNPQTAPVQYVQAPPQMMVSGPVAGGGAAAPSGGTAAVVSAKDSGLIEVASPMVGTFYSSSNPDSEAYVRVGQPVDENTVVCLIEAMKVFNEIKAEKKGTIEKILVASGQVVEFGQPLFLLRP